MTYVPLHMSVYTHRKTLKFTRTLQIEVDSAVGKLGRLWNWAIDNAPDGQLLDIDAGMIADVMNWRGDEQQLLSALITAGFIDITEEQIMSIHAWEEYGGRLNDQRSRNAKKQQDYRNRHVTVTLPAKVKENKVKENKVKKSTSLPSQKSEDVITIEVPYVAIATAAQEDTHVPLEIIEPVPTKPRSPALQARDAFWVALEDAIEHPCPVGQEKLWGKMVTAFKTTYKATPDEIRTRARIHREIKDFNFSLNSLMKHWYDCDPAKQRSQTGTKPPSEYASNGQRRRQNQGPGPGEKYPPRSRNDGIETF